MGYVSGYLAEKWQKEGMTYDEAWAKRPITTLYHRDCLGGWAQVRNIQVDQDETSVGKRSCPPGVLLQPILDQSDLKMQEIRTTWAKYFPDVHETDWETYQTPVPTDPEFWTGYAEPVECFLSSARLVFEICHGLHEDKRNRRSAIVQLLGSLSTLTASIRPFFYYARGEYKVGWKSPSLLAIVFMMLGTDLAGRYRFIGCSNCGYIFLTKSYRGKYCSQKCKSGFHHRRPASLRPDTKQTKRTA
jgi:hypothetical protein